MVPMKKPCFHAGISISQKSQKNLCKKLPKTSQKRHLMVPKLLNLRQAPCRRPFYFVSLHVEVRQSSKCLFDDSPHFQIPRSARNDIPTNQTSICLNT